MSVEHEGTPQTDAGRATMATDAPLGLWPLSDAMQDPEPEAVMRLDDGERGAVLVSVGEVGLLSAPGGAGKSYLSLAWARAAAGAERGGPWGVSCGFRLRPGPVWIVSYEDVPARIGARARAILQSDDAGAAGERVQLVLEPDALFLE